MSCRYDKFSYDITDALTNGTDGTHELIVGVYDPTEFAHIPLGKQRHNVPSTDIFYTATSGIWQTVWLEPVSISSAKQFHATIMGLLAKYKQSLCL